MAVGSTLWMTRGQRRGRILFGWSRGVSAPRACPWKPSGPVQVLGEAQTHLQCVIVLWVLKWSMV